MAQKLQVMVTCDLHDEETEGFETFKFGTTDTTVDHRRLRPSAARRLDTADIYELNVERHRAAATVVTSNREPIESLGLMADPLLAQSAVDRLQFSAPNLLGTVLYYFTAHEDIECSRTP